MFIVGSHFAREVRKRKVYQELVSLSGMWYHGCCKIWLGISQGSCTEPVVHLGAQGLGITTKAEKEMVIWFENKT